MQKVTFADKVAIDIQSGIADINKVSAADMNELKAVINSLIDEGISATIKAENEKRYRVGALIFDTNNTNPATYLGFGTWQLWGSGCVPVGVDTTQTEFATAEKTGGSKSITLTEANLPAHTHSVGAHAHGLNSHTHTYDKVNTPTGGPSNNTSGTATGNTGSTTLTTNHLPAHTHGNKELTGAINFRRYNSGNTDLLGNWVSTGGILSRSTVTWSGSHGYINASSSNLTNPTVEVLNVNATHEHDSVGGGQGHTHSLNSHTHSLNSHTHTTSTTSTNSGAANGNTANSTAFNSGSTGSGTAVNNLQPYITCYIWKRIS